MAEQEVAESVITDEMRKAIGKESPPTTLDVEKTNCRMFARSVGHTDKIFYDEAYAKSKGHRSIVAAPGFFGTPVFRPGGGRSEGPPAQGFSIPYKRVLNGGTDYEYFDSVCAGDTITAITKISGFTERAGSIGPMLITERETAYTNQDGKLVAKMLGTTIQY